jgi:hypothetical protein
MNDLITWMRVQWDRTAAIALFVGGLLSLLLGWLGVSDTPHIAAQMPYLISGGLLGLFLLGAAAALWLSADMRDEWTQLDSLRQLIESGASTGSEALPVTAPSQPTSGV